MSGGGMFLSSPPLTVSYLLGCLPGGSRRYMNHPVEVSAEAPVPISPPLNELNEALLLQKVQVTLDSPRAAREPPG
jgi:hypothetical protein